MTLITIDDVLHRLDAIVEDAKRESSAKGYFAALYRAVTRRVRRGILDGDFDDGPRMERLDVVFAARYLEAYDRHAGGRDPGLAWRLAFTRSERWRPVVLQHLLLGINAHINLDLAVAAARVAPGEQLAALEADFDRINAILGSMVDGVEDDLGEMWPALRVLDVVGGGSDEALINFMMKVARDHAWAAAQKLAALPEERQGGEIGRLDQAAYEVGRRVASPGWLVTWKLLLVRLTERGTVAEKIELLA